MIPSVSVETKHSFNCNSHEGKPREWVILCSWSQKCWTDLSQGQLFREDKPPLAPGLRRETDNTRPGSGVLRSLTFLLINWGSSISFAFLWLCRFFSRIWGKIPGLLRLRYRICMFWNIRRNDELWWFYFKSPLGPHAECYATYRHILDCATL